MLVGVFVEHELPFHDPLIPWEPGIWVSSDDHHPNCAPVAPSPPRWHLRAQYFFIPASHVENDDR